MKTATRILLCCFIVLTVASSFMGLACLLNGRSAAKLIQSSGIFCAIAALLQLEVSGLFEHWIDKYGDVEKYPGGPPSGINRQIMDDPDAPIKTWIRNTLFFERQTGLYLGIVSALLNLVGTWLP